MLVDPRDHFLEDSGQLASTGSRNLHSNPCQCYWPRISHNKWSISGWYRWTRCTRHF